MEKKNKKTKQVKEDTDEVRESVSKEEGGPKGPEPTRYGDWESKGRCVDF